MQNRCHTRDATIIIRFETSVYDDVATIKPISNDLFTVVHKLYTVYRWLWNDGS